jgi:hypothetical protein
MDASDAPDIRRRPHRANWHPAKAIWASGFSDSRGSHLTQAEARFHNQSESQKPEGNHF